MKDIYDNLDAIPCDKKIAIWGLCRESMEVFCQTINNRIKVTYFIAETDEHDGTFVFDKMVLNKDDLIAKQNFPVDGYVLIGPKQYEKHKEWINENLNNPFYVVDLGGLTRQFVATGKLYIWGAGKSGKNTLHILHEQGVRIDGFIDSSEEKIGKEYCGYPIYCKDILTKDATVIISTIYYPEIYKEVRGIIDECNVYCDFRNSRKGNSLFRYEDMKSIWINCDSVNLPMQMLEKIDVLFPLVWNDYMGKKIILYGINEITKQIIDILGLMGLRVDYLVDDVVEEESLYGYPVRNVRDLVNENISDKLILVVKIDPAQTKKAGVLCVDSGEALEKAGIQRCKGYRYLTSFRSGVKKIIQDAVLDWCNIYDNSSSDYPGFYVHGTEKGATKKVVILGNSVADGGYYEHFIKSWPEQMADKYRDIVVYNGAMGGYETTKECLKLLRDVAQLKPDFVISYSGVCDVSQPKMEGYCFSRIGFSRYYDTCLGVQNHSSLSQCWIVMERYMKALSDVNGHKFISILQPALITRKEEEYTKEEKRFAACFMDEENKFVAYKSFCDEIKENMKQYSWMYDFSNVFDGVKEQVYRDEVHLTVRGSEIIAEKVYAIIRDYDN
ncbi:MAG: hypothetical protein J6B90_09245 [Lachnospiraceae bacterium]|nr:hypothetical protein [Lachnospiraceae bacterium]